jgi:polyisoprenoid-binding protein YceI
MSQATAVPAGTWVAEPTHSRVGFSVKHLGIATVHGEFDEFDGSLTLGEDLASAKLTASVKVASVNTKEAARDEHLRSADFFNAEENPEITFESTEIAPAGDDEFTVTGNLTIAGVTNQITLKAESDGTETDPWGNERVGLELTGALSRGDYGMKFNQALGSGNVLVGDKVKIHVDISAVKQG